MAEEDTEVVDVFCPRCDKKYTGPTRVIALGLVRAHLAAQESAGDEAHIGVLDQWDDS